MNILHLAENFPLIPCASLDELATHLQKYQKVILCGVGKSYHICNLVALMANSYGLKWYSLRANDAFHGDIGIISDVDPVIFLSTSGFTQEVCDVARHLRYNHKIAITNAQTESKLEKFCSSIIRLPFLHGEQSHHLHAPISSTVIQLASLNYLVNKIATNISVPVEIYSNNHPSGSIGQKLQGEYNHA